MNQIDSILLQGAQVLVPADVVKEWMTEHLYAVYRKGFDACKRMMENDTSKHNTLYSVKDVAKILNRSEQSVRKLCYDHKIAFIPDEKCIKISQKAINEFIKNNEIKANYESNN